MFDGFDEFDIATSATTIHGRHGGEGEPVLLLHGIPETHLMWHHVAPRLAERLTVVATDLRGFGDSGKPPSTPDHAPYSMREIARDQIEVMQTLGYDRFMVVGHDRGARCAYRMALDHPDAVTRLAVLDIIPTGDTFQHADKDFSLGFWVWSFLAAPEPVPEHLIAQAPAVMVDYMLDSWSDRPDTFPADLRAVYTDKFRNPDTIHAICEEYRASVTLDYEHDEADRGKRRITCPVLALWSRTGAFASRYQPLEVWRAWADDVEGGPISAGHFLAEEAPEETARRLLEFLT
ncbi:alpha/beta fold hydrolase [Micromonospora deserti]|uniref:alpha/beta fold hydrolase n=1 Tax=Micromonospora deserti TaxID=2070366 RepID=UPI0018F70B87|nr:alpha/beta hydrolase [Micromonospora deserti]